MTLIAKENPRLSNVLKRELWSEQGFCRLAVTAQEASETTYKVGQVLGKITASGKYKIRNDASVVGEEGAEVAAAVVLEEVDLAAATDTTVLVLVKGPAIVADSGLVFPDGTLQAEKDEAYAELEALNINVDKQI